MPCAIQPGLVTLHDRQNGVIWPWDVLHYLWNSPNHSEFFAWVHDPPEEANQRCAEYWSRSSHLPFYQKLTIDNPETTIPIAWHVDGVKIYKTHKAWVYSFSSAIKKGPSLISKSLVLLFREAVMVKPFTHDAVGRIVAYIMKVLQTGLFPSQDFSGNDFPKESVEEIRSGTPFAGGWKGAFACFKADLEARVLVHKLVRNWASDSMCEHCLASRLPQFTYGDFSDRAAYWECMFTHEEFFLLNPASRQSTWLNVPGWDKDRNLDEPWPKNVYTMNFD